MTRKEAINRAAVLKITLIKLTATKPQNTNLTTWLNFFSKYPMRTRTQDPQFGLLGFIEHAEQKIAHYKKVLAELENDK